MNSDQIPGLLNHRPGSFITDWKYPIMLADILSFDILFKAISDLLRDEYHFSLSAAFRRPQQQFSFNNIIGSKFQHLTDTHSTASHQFEHETIPGLCGPKDDFIHGLLFQSIPMNFHLWPVQLAQYLGVAWVDEIRNDVVFDKVEKCGKVGISDAFGLGLGSVCKLIQKL